MLYPIDHVLAGWKNLKKAERTTNHLIFCKLDKFLGGNEQLKLQCNASINKSRSIELAEVECVLSGAQELQKLFYQWDSRCSPGFVQRLVGIDMPTYQTANGEECDNFHINKSSIFQTPKNSS